MVRICDATGLLIKHLVLVIIAIMQELIMRKNVDPTAARLLNDGKKYVIHSLLNSFV
jgi:hypothetical protein